MQTLRKDLLRTLNDEKGGPHFETRPSLLLHILLFSLFFDPLTCIYESFNPWSYLIAVYAVGRIIGVLPWEDGTLQVRHHCQMAAVCAGQGSYRIIGTVRVARIFVVGYLATTLYWSSSYGRENFPSPCATQIPSLLPLSEPNITLRLVGIVTPMKVDSNLCDSLCSIFPFFSCSGFTNPSSIIN